MKYIILAGSLLLANLAWSQAATTNSGYMACTSETYLDDFISFINAGDKASMSAYISSNKCVSLKSGLKITVVDSSGFLGSKVQFVYSGAKFWTVMEAINR